MLNTTTMSWRNWLRRWVSRHLPGLVPVINVRTPPHKMPIPPASSIRLHPSQNSPGSLYQQPTALSFLIIRVLNNSPGHVLKATLPRDAVTAPVQWRHLPAPAATRTLLSPLLAAPLSGEWHRLSTGKVLMHVAVFSLAAPLAKLTPASGISRRLTSLYWRQAPTT